MNWTKIFSCQKRKKTQAPTKYTICKNTINEDNGSLDTKKPLCRAILGNLPANGILIKLILAISPVSN